MTRPASRAEWLLHGTKGDWTPPPLASLILRLPIIRHVRTLWHLVGAARHQAAWGSMGYLETGYDDWVLAGMWRGWI